MVEVTYYCPYCGAVTSLERDAYLADKCVTREPLAGWEYAGTTEDYESADGVEFVCIGDRALDPDEVREDVPEGGDGHPDYTRTGCGRTFYLSFVKYEDGAEVPHRQPEYDRPRFDFLR